MIDITATSNGNVFGDAIRRLSNSREALSAAADVAKTGVQRNFETERSGTGPWTPLEKSTVADRAKVGLGPHPILFRGGNYGPRTRRPARILRETFQQDSPLDLSDDSVVIGSRDPRVAALREVRPSDSIVALQQEDARAVFDALIEKLTRG